MRIKTKRGARRIRNQRVIDRRFVVTDYEYCSYITVGKLYRLFDDWQTIDDEGHQTPVRHVGFLAAIFEDEGTWYHPIR